MHLAILIPAAGASTRMRGADKCFEDVGGTPCLTAMIQRALKVTNYVVVTIPSADHRRGDLTEGAISVVCENAQEGMSASLKIGVASLPSHTTALMILPADMPSITASDLSMMWAVFQASHLKVLQAATSDGIAGHPVIFDKSLFAQFDELSGDRGAVSIINGNAKLHGLIQLEGDRAILDLDTPEAWNKWRADGKLSGLAALLGNQYRDS